MAIVTGPLHSSEARGAVGALVYNSYRGRAYTKARSTPTVEYSDPQIAARAMMHTIYGYWLGLSPADRSHWSDWAEENHLCDWTGQLKRLSSWNWFAKINYLLLNNTSLWNTQPPNPITSYSLSGLISYQRAPMIVFQWTIADPPPDPAWFLEFWSVGPHPPTLHPSVKMAKRVDPALEADGAFSYLYTLPGSYTTYIRPLSTQGITMPYVRILTEVT